MQTRHSKSELMKEDQISVKQIEKIYIPDQLRFIPTWPMKTTFTSVASCLPPHQAPQCLQLNHLQLTPFPSLKFHQKALKRRKEIKINIRRYKDQGASK